MVVTWPGNENRCSRPFSVTPHGIRSCSLSRTFHGRSNSASRDKEKRAVGSTAFSGRRSRRDATSTSCRNFRKGDPLYGNGCDTYLLQRGTARNIMCKNCARLAPHKFSLRILSARKSIILFCRCRFLPRGIFLDYFSMNPCSVHKKFLFFKNLNFRS